MKNTPFQAAKRAFDTVIEVVNEVRPGETNIDKCVSSGASKVTYNYASNTNTQASLKSVSQYAMTLQISIARKI